MCSELEERVVLYLELHPLEVLVRREVGEFGVGGKRDVPRHDAEDVRDPESGEDLWGLGCSKVAEEDTLGNLRREVRL